MKYIDADTLRAENERQIEEALWGEQKPSNAYQLWFGNEMKDQKPADKLFEEWIDGWFKEHKEKAYPQITMDEKEFKNFCRGIRNMYWQNPFAIHFDNSQRRLRQD